MVQACFRLWGVLRAVSVWLLVGATLLTLNARAETAARKTKSEIQEPETLLGPAPPYLPRQTDYSLDLGYMNAFDDLFWASALIGAHVGRCVASESQTCQQYLDGIAGFGIREAESHGHFLASLRWQYVNFPKRYSPFWRVFGGAAYISRPEHRGWHPAVGVGAGVVTYLHKKVDLRFEARTGVADRAYVQGFIGLHIKADELLKFFALKLRDLGYGTVTTAIEATGTAIEATGEGIEAVVEGVASPFKDEDSVQEPKASKNPTPTP